eukprot:15470834-Alexandrium_andersonii.AAC.1
MRAGFDLFHAVAGCGAPLWGGEPKGSRTGPLPIDLRHSRGGAGAESAQSPGPLPRPVPLRAVSPEAHAAPDQRREGDAQGRPRGG